MAGKVVVVTGATKGIGKGIAKMCAAEGAWVVVSGRSEQDGKKVVREIKEASGSNALFIKTDVNRPEDCRKLIELTVEHFGRIDGLVNNAGIFPRGDMLDTTEELFDTVFNVNIKGAFFCSQYAIKAMARNGGGSIVQIGSTNAYKGQKDLAAYSCSKGAMLTLSRHIAGNYAEQGIRCSWITAGWVATEGEIEIHGRMGVTADRLNEMGKETIPSGRLQTADDNAYGVIYLLSDESVQCLLDAVRAAQQGMKSTVNMLSQKGKSSRLGERALGHQDPSATSAYFILSSFCNSVNSMQRA